MSNILDRRLAPKASSFRHIPLPSVEKVQLSNGLDVYLLPYGTAEVIEIQAVFKGGSNYQPKAGIAKFCLQNLVEATQKHNSLELAQELDGYGAWMGQQAEEEALSLNLATLSKNLKHTLYLLKEVITEPAFSEKEFSTLKKRSLQKMHVAEQKTANKANRAFRQKMFGPAHPYGLSFDSEALKSIELAELKAYYQTYLQPANMCLLVSGNYHKSEVLALIEKEFGGLARSKVVNISTHIPASSFESGRSLIEHEGMQSSLRLGHKGIARGHADYYGMQVVNTILGGYFGSRLMHNIREEKGYTYGIYSGFLGMKHEGFFVVQTDVGNEYAEPTIGEIKKEMKTLCEEKVSVEELELVKNYMLGQGISRRETLYQLGDTLRFSLSQEISFEEIDRKFSVINEISAEEVQELANKYLHPDDMLEVVVGKPA
ncbi:MAG: pitrilysin family protein [Bacteroidota bacterium]